MHIDILINRVFRLLVFPNKYFINQEKIKNYQMIKRQLMVCKKIRKVHQGIPIITFIVFNLCS
jgi:hypothetical protein